MELIQKNPQVQPDSTQHHSNLKAYISESVVQTTLLPWLLHEKRRERGEEGSRRERGGEGRKELTKSGRLKKMRFHEGLHGTTAGQTGNIAGKVHCPCSGWLVVFIWLLKEGLV